MARHRRIVPDGEELPPEAEGQIARIDERTRDLDLAGDNCPARRAPPKAAEARAGAVNRRLAAEQIAGIRRSKGRVSVRKLASFYGVSASAVQKVLSGKALEGAPPDIVVSLEELSELFTDGAPAPAGWSGVALDAVRRQGFSFRAGGQTFRFVPPEHLRASEEDRARVAIAGAVATGEGIEEALLLYEVLSEDAKAEVREMVEDLRQRVLADRAAGIEKRPGRLEPPRQSELKSVNALTLPKKRARKASR
jgi:hypothetical protein